jgi:SAM-dependent methyltransferase
MLQAALRQGKPILDRVFEDLTNPDPTHVWPGMERLVSGLGTLKKRLTPSSWETFCRTVCVTHPVRYLVHQDPLTERSYFKPRGYAGDPVLMDFYYGTDNVGPYLDRVTDLGRRIYDYTSNSKVARGFRRRREIMATLIDRVARETRGARILTLDCGHLREVEICQAVRRRQVDRFLAVDRDPESLRLVQERFGPLGVETAVSTVQELLEEPQKLGTFDLIYSAGVYDYLHRGLAARVTRALFKNLRPGGSLLVTNLVHGITDVGYLEAFMDWRLEFRDAQDMFALTASLPERGVADRRTFVEGVDGIAYMIVKRA